MSVNVREGLIPDTGKFAFLAPVRLIIAIFLLETHVNADERLVEE